MPSVLPRPVLREGVFFLRPPAPPRPESEAMPVYTEEQMQTARRESEEQGLARARAEMEALRSLLEVEGQTAVREMVEAAGAIRGQRAVLLEAAAEGVVDLAFRVAERVTRSRIEAAPDSIVVLVRELLRRSAAAATVRVRLSERDYSHLMRALATLPEAAGMEGLSFRCDASLTPGGCVVETEAGSLDGRLETMLERIGEALRSPEEEMP